MVVVVLAGFDINRLLDTGGFLGRRIHAGGLDGGFVDADGLLDDLRVVVMVVVAVDSSLGHANVLSNGSRTVVAMRTNGGLVDADSLLDYLRAVVVVRVVRVMRVAGGVLRAVDNRLGHTNFLTVAGLVSSTIFTLDLVNGAVVLLRERLVVVVGLVMVVVPVRVDFNKGVRVGGTSWSVHKKASLG